MSQVMYGRRKGQTKESMKPTVGSQMPPSLQTSGFQLQGGTDLRQVAVLTGSDWDRIQYQLNKKQIEADRRTQARAKKEQERMMSLSTVKNWSNTIAGQRQKKLQARKIREAKEEEEKKQIDLEEAKLQAKMRKEAIEKAKTQQYYQTDRVKGFHSALQLTEVLKERDAQVELKRLKEKVTEGQDREWLEMTNRQREEGILMDQSKAMGHIIESRQVADFQKAQKLKEYQKAQKLKEYQKAQIREHLKDRLREEIDDRKEGDELKKLAIQYHDEKARLEEIRRQEVTTLAATNIQQIADVRQMRTVLKEQEDEEDEECRLFAAAKRKMVRLRAEKEKKLHKDKLDRLDKIREKLHAQMKMAKDDEDQRIQKATNEAEAKRLAEEEQKNRKQEAGIRSAAEWRAKQMKDKDDKAAEDRRKELELLMIRREADDLFQRNEEEKSSRKFVNNKKLSQFHLDRVAEQKQKEADAREAALAQDERNIELLGIEEKQFQEYAGRVINHCEKGGRNVYPLKKAAMEGIGGGLGPVFHGKGGIRPSYMTNDQSGVQLPNFTRSGTEETKQNIYGDGKTGKRLGFVY